MLKRILAAGFAAAVLSVGTAGTVSAGQPPCPGGSGVDTDVADVCLKNGRKL